MIAGVGEPFGEPLADPAIVHAEHALAAARARVEVAETRFFRGEPDDQELAYAAYIAALRAEMDAASKLEAAVRDAQTRRLRPPDGFRRSAKL